MTFAPNLLAEDILIKNAKIHTVSEQGVLLQSDIYISDGYIMNVGKSLSPTGNYKVIDATGKTVTPGLSNPMTQLGLEEISAAPSTVDYATENKRHTASFAIYPAINMYSTLVPHNRINGLTRAIVQPLSPDNVFQGSGASIALVSNESGLLKESVAQFVNYGIAGSEAAGGSKASAYAVIDKALEEANYLRNNRTRYEPGFDWHFSLSVDDLDALKPVLERQIPMVVSANRRSDILQMVKLADKHSVNIIIAGAAEAWTVADQLARAKIPVMFDPMQNVPASFDSLAVRLDAAAILSEAGVELIIGFASSHNAYLVRQSAANAVANGLSEDKALEALTINPAKYFGIENYGRIAIGMEADLVIWDGPPFEITSSADAVIIKGEEQPMVSRSTRLRDRYWQPSSKKTTAQSDNSDKEK
jgi:imidazolonepropionase-like amidohydrolase